MGADNNPGTIGLAETGNDIAIGPSGNDEGLAFDGGSGLSELGRNIICTAGKLIRMLKIAGAEIAGQLFDVGAQAVGIDMKAGRRIPAAGRLAKAN